MEQDIKSEGKCFFCGKTFAKAGIIRHLKTHLLQKNETIGKEGLSFLLKIEPKQRGETSPYFLSLWVTSDAKMKDIDQFLRDIWLECCGHLSAFTNPKNRTRLGMWNFFEGEELLAQGKTKAYEELMEDTMGEIPMGRKVKDVFYPGLKLDYEYDFGSSTDLQLTVVDSISVKPDKKIVLLSRNEPLAWLCDLCKKEPAKHICTAHDWGEDSLFCDKCAKKHAKKCEDFEYAGLPVVNSPRAGVCCYQGGVIDLEKD